MTLHGEGMQLKLTYSEVAHLLGDHGQRFHRVLSLCPPEVRRRAYLLLIGEDANIKEVRGVGEGVVASLDEQMNISYEHWQRRGQRVRESPNPIPETGAIAQLSDWGLWGSGVRRRDFVYFSSDEHVLVDCPLWHWGEKTIKNLRDYAMVVEGFAEPKKDAKPEGLVRLRMAMFELQLTLDSLEGSDKAIGRQYTEEALHNFRQQGLLEEVDHKPMFNWLGHRRLDERME